MIWCRVYLYQGTFYLYLELILFGIMCKQGIIILWCKWCTILYLFCCQFWENVGGVIISVYFKGFSAILWLSGRSGEVYLIGHYVIKFVKWPAADRLWWFSLGTLVPSANKTDCHNITEVLLKVALCTITP